MLHHVAHGDVGENCELPAPRGRMLASAPGVLPHSPMLSLVCPEWRTTFSGMGQLRNSMPHLSLVFMWMCMSVATTTLQYVCSLLCQAGSLEIMDFGRVCILL